MEHLNSGEVSMTMPWIPLYVGMMGDESADQAAKKHLPQNTRIKIIGKVRSESGREKFNVHSRGRSEIF